MQLICPNCGKENFSNDIVNNIFKCIRCRTYYVKGKESELVNVNKTILNFKTNTNSIDIVLNNHQNWAEIVRFVQFMENYGLQIFILPDLDAVSELFCSLIQTIVENRYAKNEILYAQYEHSKFFEKIYIKENTAMLYLVNVGDTNGYIENLILENNRYISETFNKNQYQFRNNILTIKKESIKKNAFTFIIFICNKATGNRITQIQVF